MVLDHKHKKREKKKEENNVEPHKIFSRISFVFFIPAFTSLSLLSLSLYLLLSMLMFLCLYFSLLSLSLKPSIESVGFSNF